MSAGSRTTNSARREADEMIDQLWLKDDPSALARAHKRYRTQLEAVAFRILRNHADAEDVVQRIFMGARNGSYGGRASLWTYLYRAAVNGSVNVLRSKGRRAKLERKVYEHHLVSPLRPAEANPEAQVLESEMMAAVAKALLRVKPQHRRVLTLRVIHGLTNSEIAAREDLPLATVGTWLRRGRIELQRSLRPLLKDMGKSI
jgi:RNA polymerase sigma-70 factor (ECF subfamily)